MRRQCGGRHRARCRNDRPGRAWPSSAGAELRRLSLVESKVRAQRTQGLAGRRHIFLGVRPTDFHANAAPSQQGLGMFEPSPLPLRHRQAFVQVFACPVDRTFQRRDESGFTQRVRQVVLKRPGDLHGLASPPCVLASAKSSGVAAPSWSSSQPAGARPRPAKDEGERSRRS